MIIDRFKFTRNSKEILTNIIYAPIRITGVHTDIYGIWYNCDIRYDIPVVFNGETIIGCDFEIQAAEINVRYSSQKKIKPVDVPIYFVTEMYERFTPHELGIEWSSDQIKTFISNINKTIMRCGLPKAIISGIQVE